MKMLHILPRAIQEFKSGVINRSEEIGLLYWLDDSEKEMIEKFEEKWEGNHNGTDVFPAVCI